MKLEQLFYAIKSIVKTSENYIPRNYNTIGGIWTIETYKKLNVVFQIMDEGYTNRIITDDIQVICDCNNNIEIKKGNKRLLEDVLKYLEENKNKR